MNMKAIVIPQFGDSQVLTVRDTAPASRYPVRFAPLVSTSPDYMWVNMSRHYPL
ncbi:hypothetical protein DFQ01_103437 [Paenibacillus cellulosilyticus]|uniref:Uncharacterized protein n=1 Tax=Paenibacillus cellulosilyticus TaxID=375489 RepID=A0A2V2YY16_9BACL|nr:hypothetical protein [Paenibacillus cellulosilyticus]PWW06533.1 hypothetical protein DFQ01_103437 [Paenibacillus cellulosilyticus]QKS46130.1 hypothetical protein HUB94_18080 [Paenibacillus cellulosilyticus]